MQRSGGGELFGKIKVNSRRPLIPAVTRTNDGVMKQLLAVVVSLLLATVLQAESAWLKMRFVFDGDPPAPKQIVVPAQLAAAGIAVPDESLLVDSESKGIQNVVVYVTTGHQGTSQDLEPYKGVKRRLITRNGLFVPHVLLARAGDTLEMANGGPFAHSISIAFLNNPSVSPLRLRNASHVLSLDRPEPAPIPVECNIYPWMNARVVILDHSFAAISDERGEVFIAGLPSNTELVFKVYHERGRIEQVEFDGVASHWKRSQFQIKLSPGENDLGEILVPAAAFVK